MKNAGIVMDDYKVATFRKNLKNAGFKWTEHPGINKSTQTFIVAFRPEDSTKLEKVIFASNAVCTQRN